MLIADSVTQPLPHPHFAPLPIPTLQTPQEVREHLTDIYNDLSQARQAAFQDVARKHSGWANDMEKAQPFLVEIHATFKPMQEVAVPPAPVVAADPWETATVAAPKPAPIPAAVPPVAPAPVPSVQTTPAVVATPPAPAPVTQADVPEEEREEDVPEEVTEAEDPELDSPVSEEEGTEETPSTEETQVLELAANPHGLFSQLYVICGEGGDVSLLVRRIGKQLQVILTPSGAKGEQGKNLKPAAATSTPEELDAEFALALTEYAADRQTQAKKALSVTQQVRQSMQKSASKTPPAKAATPAKSTPKKSEGILQVSANVPAKLSLKGETGKPETHEVGPDHKDLKLKPGKYKLSVQADGYLAVNQEVSIEDGQTNTVQLALVSAGLGF